MGILQVKDDKIILRRRDEIAVIEPFGRDILRFRSSRADDWWMRTDAARRSCAC